MEEIAIHFLITREDFLQFRKAAGKAETRRGEILFCRVVGALLILGGILGCIFLAGGFTKVSCGVLAFAGLVVGFYHDTLQPVLSHRAAYLYYETNQKRLAARTIVFSEDQVHIRTDRYTGRLPYELFYRVYEAPDVILFYIGIGEIYFIPKRTLSEEEQKRLQAHLRRRIKEKYVQEGVQ